MALIYTNIDNYGHIDGDAYAYRSKSEYFSRLLSNEPVEFEFSTTLSTIPASNINANNIGNALDNYDGGNIQGILLMFNDPEISSSNVQYFVNLEAILLPTEIDGSVSGTLQSLPSSSVPIVS